MGLPEESEALQDVDTLCEELGLQRGEVCRLLVITWSKARRGKVQELWGFTPGVMSTPYAGGSGGVPSSGQREELPAATPAPRRKTVVSETAAAAVQGLNLDLD